jgi:hypothetical protein
VSARYDIQSGEDGTFIVRSEDGGEYARIARFIPGEYTAEDESILGNAHGLADALEACRREMVSEASGIGADDYHEAINTARAALRKAGRLP